MSKEKQIAAFFDLDGTLLSVNSGRLWVEQELRLGHISYLTYIEAILYLVGYRLNRINIDTVMLRALKPYQGVSEEAVRHKTKRWYLNEVAPKAAPGANAVLEEHRQKGHRMVLLTSSSVYESEIACEHFGLEAFLCTRYEVEKGRFTGKPQLPICYGKGKVFYAEDYAKKENIDIEKSYFYTDSASDLPMLHRVGHPRIVNPDFILKRKAKRMKWPILDWQS